MGGAISPLLLYVFMASKGSRLPLSAPNGYIDTAYSLLNRASHKEHGTMITMTWEDVVADFTLLSREALPLNLTASFGQGILARHVQ